MAAPVMGPDQWEYFCLLLSKLIYRNEAGKAISANCFHVKGIPTSK